MTVILARSRAADCISMKWKPAAPSPVTHTTSRAGLPSFAPSAAGTPVPEHAELEDAEIRARSRRGQEPVRPERGEAAVGHVDRARAEGRADRLDHARRVQPRPGPALDHAHLLLPPLLRRAPAAREEA